jgi:hypothetical protein
MLFSSSVTRKEIGVGVAEVLNLYIFCSVGSSGHTPICVKPEEVEISKPDAHWPETLLERRRDSPRRPKIGRILLKFINIVFVMVDNKFTKNQPPE